MGLWKAFFQKEKGCLFLNTVFFKKSLSFEYLHCHCGQCKDTPMQKPFLKWPGGKFRLLDRILPALPLGKRLVEPFAGSGAVFLNASFPAFLICDVNSDLITLFRLLKTEGEAFIAWCESFFIPENNTSVAFYALRNRFNHSTDPPERAALLLYLNRHAFNGMVRYNAQGNYNVPFGRYQKPYFPKTELYAFARKARENATEFVVQDFATTFAYLNEDDVVYCDPPYVPLSETANFTSYAGSTFGVGRQKELANLAIQAAQKGIPVVLSNHDTPFTRQLYAPAHLDLFAVQRSISCKGRTRGLAPELMAVFS